MAGFAASCYMRGIDFYNMPTTLLAQVDSSVGGKTAVDFEGVKNAVGTFWQPKKVLIDSDTLRTLEPRQIHAGLAESIKMAATCDESLLTRIEKSSDLFCDLPSIIEGSVQIKSEIVKRDPKEKGLRRVLNFGHTVGHAIESLHGGRLLHGECVALGMLPMCSAPVRQRLRRLLQKYQLPTEMTDPTDSFMPYILHDKKMQSGVIHTVYVEEIGTFQMRDLTPAELYKEVEAAR